LLCQAAAADEVALLQEQSLCLVVLVVTLSLVVLEAGK
jgi:hypothetical protein